MLSVVLKSQVYVNILTL